MRGGAALLAAAGLLLLGACGSHGEPGGVTPDEARQLDDAAAMLDANAVSANAMIDNREDQ